MFMNNAIFGKAMDDVRKHRDIKIVITERRMNYLVSEPNYHTTNFFIENLLAIKKTEILMNIPVCLGHSILELSKILMQEFWYDRAKPKYCEKVKLCYMDTNSFVLYIKTDHIYKDIADDVETRFYTSSYELDRALPKGKNKKVIELMKNELNGIIMTKFVGLRAKFYSYLIDDGSEDTKTEPAKKCVIKRKLKFENYKNYLEATQFENKINYLEKNKIDIDSFQKIINNP